MIKNKIYIKLFTILTLFSIFSAFSNKQSKVEKDKYPWSIGKENKYIFDNEDSLILTLKEGTLTPAGATFNYKNVGTDVVYFGLRYFLQTQLNDKWFNMVSNIFWTLELVHLNPGEEIELSTDWSNYYGELPPGNYRFIKEYHVSKPLADPRYVNYTFTINANQ